MTNPKTEFKSDNQKTLELIELKNVKKLNQEIFNTYSSPNYRNSNNVNNIGEILIELVKNNSNDFTKDIAKKCLKNEINPTYKQSWCLVYQINNNQEVYKMAIKEI